MELIKDQMGLIKVSLVFLSTIAIATATANTIWQSFKSEWALNMG